MLQTLQAVVADSDLYFRLANKLDSMLSAIQQHAQAAGIAFQYVVRGAMFGYFFSDNSEITTFEQVNQCDQQRFKFFFSCHAV